MKAIEWLFDDEFQNVFQNIGRENWQDLRQEIAVIVLEYDQTKIQEITDKGKNDFKFWVSRLCTNQINPHFGQLFRKLNQYSKKVKFVHVSDPGKFHSIQDEPEPDIEQIAKLMNEKIETLHFYDKKVFLLYLEKGSVRKVAEQLKIPHTSIFYTIKKVQKCLKQSLS